MVFAVTSTLVALVAVPAFFVAAAWAALRLGLGGAACAVVGVTFLLAAALVAEAVLDSATAAVAALGLAVFVAVLAYAVEFAAWLKE